MRVSLIYTLPIYIICVVVIRRARLEQVLYNIIVPTEMYAPLMTFIDNTLK